MNVEVSRPSENLHRKFAQLQNPSCLDSGKVRFCRASQQHITIVQQANGYLVLQVERGEELPYLLQ